MTQWRERRKQAKRDTVGCAPVSKEESAPVASPPTMATAICLHMGAVITFLIVCVSARFLHSAEKSEFREDEERVVGTVLEAASQPTCSLLLFTDGTQPSGNVAKIIQQTRPPCGVGVFQISEPNQSQFIQVVTEARKVRSLLMSGGRILNLNLVHFCLQDCLKDCLSVALSRQMRIASRCASVVVVSRSEAFLARFAASSLRGRLLVWETRLLLVTQLNTAVLRALLREHWNFAMMNSAALNLEEQQGRRSFHGARVNLTALPWPPNWEEETLTGSPGGAQVTRYSGTDYFAMETLADILNFSINLIPTNDFVEVTNKVEERTAFITGLTYAIIPKRLERHDFILAYDFFYSTFSMATPSIETHWQSLFRPLSLQVWAAVASSLFVVSVAVRLMCCVTEEISVTTSHAFQELFKILLGQDLGQRFARTLTGRMVFGAWLVFALVVGSAYRGNLTASLTLPVRPSRPETLREIVEVADG
ncbi:uncharacterized protein LOC119577510 [Penaeus monodon]|uniref:uncharacterized protein LOC119577510 n=1 Tax=Penaeus monodon TaxID=6687 RepID=UPI0018A76819|nr:uncharacterized protein LOC119577510 [Penaeus monodon]